MLIPTCYTLAGILFMNFQGMMAQGNTKNLVAFMDAVPNTQSIQEDLGILPDTSSYFIEEESHTADTVTRKATTYAFYNYGNIRMAIISVEGDYLTNSSKVITYRQLNDSMSLQTTMKLNVVQPETDSILILWKDGLISKVHETIFGQKNEYEFKYDQRRLIHRSVQKGNNWKYETDYTYKGTQPVYVVSIYPDRKTESYYEYSDSTIIVNQTSSSHYNYKYITRLDQFGRIISHSSYVQGPEDSELKPGQSQQYFYLPDGGYQATYFEPKNKYKKNDTKSMMEFHPGLSSTERYTWEGSDQVWIRRFFRF